jgi:hypothetical protein
MKAPSKRVGVAHNKARGRGIFAFSSLKGTISHHLILTRITACCKFPRLRPSQSAMSALGTLKVDDIIDYVRRFTLRRDFNEGRSFIQSLDKSVACLPAVALVCASFYMMLDHPKLAEECLQIAKYDSLIAKEGALIDECVAVISLLGARIKIYRYFEYDKAFALAKSVEDIYGNLQSKPETQEFASC